MGTNNSVNLKNCHSKNVGGGGVHLFSQEYYQWGKNSFYKKDLPQF